MSAKEAYKKLIAKWPDLDAISCRECETVFIFCIVPEGATNINMAKKRMDGLCSVDKKTGKVQTFKPFNIPLKEFRSGKDVKNFK